MAKADFYKRVKFTFGVTFSLERMSNMNLGALPKSLLFCANFVKLSGRDVPIVPVQFDRMSFRGFSGHVVISCIPKQVPHTGKCIPALFIFMANLK